MAGEEALAQARTMDAQGPDAKRPLWGVPVIIKDVLATVGMPTNSRLQDSGKFRPGL